MVHNSEKLRIFTLGSGSSGNSVFIRYGEDGVLIDAGLSAKAITASLFDVGFDLNKLKGIFVTHEHNDHIKGIQVLAGKCDVPIHITENSYRAADFKDVPEQRFSLHPPVFSFDCGAIRVSSFVTPHDSAMSVGYIIDTPECNVGVATDMGYMSRGVFEKLSECKYAVLESNYDEKMLIEGPYPRYLKKRISSDTGHLSNDACAETVWHLSKCGTVRVMLAHLSAENNTPQKALECSGKALMDNDCRDTAVTVAKRTEITDFFE